MTDSYDGGFRDLSSVGDMHKSCISHMKSGFPAWEEFVSRGMKFQKHFEQTISSFNSFVDSLYKISELAHNTKGGTYEIGTGLINLAMWHRGQEMKLKEMNVALMNKLLAPLQVKVEEWKKTTSTLEREHDKELQQSIKDIKDAAKNAMKTGKTLESKMKKDKSSDKVAILHQQLEHYHHETDRYLKETEERERKNLNRVLLEERSWFCGFVNAFTRVLDVETGMLVDLERLQAILKDLSAEVSHPAILPETTREILETWTIPASPASLHKKISTAPSMISVSSGSSGDSGGTGGSAGPVISGPVMPGTTYSGSPVGVPIQQPQPPTPPSVGVPPPPPPGPPPGPPVVTAQPPPPPGPPPPTSRPGEMAGFPPPPSANIFQPAPPAPPTSSASMMAMMGPPPPQPPGPRPSPPSSNIFQPAPPAPPTSSASMMAMMGPPPPQPPGPRPSPPSSNIFQPAPPAPPTSSASMMAMMGPPPPQPPGPRPPPPSTAPPSSSSSMHQPPIPHAQLPPQAPQNHPSRSQTLPRNMASYRGASLDTGLGLATSNPHYNSNMGGGPGGSPYASNGDYIQNRSLPPVPQGEDPYQQSTNSSMSISRPNLVSSTLPRSLGPMDSAGPSALHNQRLYTHTEEKVEATSSLQEQLVNRLRGRSHSIESRRELSTNQDNVVYSMPAFSAQQQQQQQQYQVRASNSMSGKSGINGPPPVSSKPPRAPSQVLGPPGPPVVANKPSRPANGHGNLGPLPPQFGQPPSFPQTIHSHTNFAPQATSPAAADLDLDPDEDNMFARALRERKLRSVQTNDRSNPLVGR